ncbi:lipopolysaccharide biosynthesis protein [Paraclostridium bifermentans]|uniref:lipopolysaccharide biosynthesis protein n=1 Tax=Paraclostridium bifermentans TaxID=1490 RepID=UPI00359C8DAB
MLKNIRYNISNNKLIKNFFVLLTGESVISVLGMLNLALIINAIGQQANGMIIMVQTYTSLFASIFAFKSFQALIKYLAASIENNDIEKAKEYIKFSYILDISACLISAIVAYIALDISFNIMGWPNELKPYVKLYIITLLFSIQGTPIGILRIYNKFNLTVYSNLATVIMRTLLYCLGYYYKLNFDFFFYTELILVLVNSLFLIIASLKTLKENELLNFYKSKLKFDKSFFMFNFYSNISSTIDIPVNQLTIMIMNKYLGFADISIYRTFEKLGSIISKLGSPISQIIYPEISMMIAKNEIDKAKKLSKKLFFGISGVGILAIIGIIFTYKYWLFIFIKDYQKYIIPLIIYFVYILYINSVTGTHTLFMSLNYIKYTIPILIVINTLYLGGLYILIKALGILGVVLSLLIQSILVVVTKIVIMKRNNYKELI